MPLQHFYNGYGALNLMPSGSAEQSPPIQWYTAPEYSPDGSKIAVQTPPPAFVLFFLKDPDGKVCQGQRVVKPKTVILNANDFSLIAQIDSELWPTWSPNGKYIGSAGINTKNPGATLNIYDASNGVKLRSIGALPLSAYAWSPDSNRLTFTQRKAIRILDIAKN